MTELSQEKREMYLKEIEELEKTLKEEEDELKRITKTEDF
ncbi:hypothetical protein PFJ87_07g01060 [Encephalitozoon hellem]|uniref:Uncharacterized protein n=1 Tax=Encephalitozoon hellem TaxID=27973 RepID=A0ABY8CJD4_ENCHE|nr:hypothetical protein PFJ87_07g01060 [Encephalitozoon hellem]